MSGAILVTGATGFVGRAVIAALADGDRPVVALVRRFVDDLPAGVIQRRTAAIETLDQDGWLTALDGIGTVIHLAAIAHIGPDVTDDHYDSVNHRAVAGLGDAARIAGVKRIVFLSSIRAQCGPSAPDVQTEASAPRPTDAYGRAKLAGEQALAASDVPYVTLRPVLIVGNAPKGNLRLLARLARLPLPLPLAGLAARRSMVSLDDVVALTIRAIDDPAMAGQVLILADGAALTIGEIVAALRRGSGRAPMLFALPETLLRLPFRMIGRDDLWQRIGGALVARSEGLTALGIPAPSGLRARLERLLRPPGR